MQVAEAHKAAGRFHGAEEHESGQRRTRHRQAQRLAVGEAARRLALLRRRRFRAPPDRQRQKQRQRQRELNRRDDAVGAAPARAAGELEGEDHRPRRRADAPEAVQPAHVARRVVQRDEVVQRRVDAARAEAERDGAEENRPRAGRERNAQQACGGHQHADGRHPAHAEAGDQAVRREAGHDRPRGDDHGNVSRERQRHAQFARMAGQALPSTESGSPRLMNAM